MIIKKITTHSVLMPNGIIREANMPVKTVWYIFGIPIITKERKFEKYED